MSGDARARGACGMQKGKEAETVRTMLENMSTTQGSSNASLKVRRSTLGCTYNSFRRQDSQNPQFIALDTGSETPRTPVLNAVNEDTTIITAEGNMLEAYNLQAHAPSPCLPARPVVVAEVGWSEFQLR